MRKTVQLCSYITLFLITNLLTAEIIETQKMAEIIPHITKDTLVIFDIDNTLVEPIQQLGSDEYFNQRIEDFQTEGFNRKQALEKTLREWTAIQWLTEVKICEPGSDSIIKALQDQKIVTMGLTTRNLGVSTRTLEQLHMLNIDLARTAPTHEEIHFMNAKPSNEVHGVLFRGGILFTAGTDKGEALRKFLEKINYSPKRIVFINDKASHIQEVEKYSDAKKIPFIGLRYGYTDAKVKKFRKEISDIQLKQFGHIISDEAAEKLLQQLKEKSGSEASDKVIRNRQ